VSPSDSLSRIFLNFGEIAVLRGLLSRDQLKEALSIQRKYKDKGFTRELGDILVELGYVTESQVNSVLAAQGKGVEGAIAGYEILAKIGQGGMGAVYKARQVSLDRIVALKTLLPNYNTAEDVKGRFLREIKAIAKLQHPNIITGYDAGEANGIHYYVMELIDGKDVRKLINKYERIPIDESLRIVTDVAKAMVHYSRAGMIHRDIKPSNILVDQSGQVKLLDLGLARHTTSTEPDLTAVGFVTGTPHYVSPEQAQAKDVDIRSDIYNLGATWFEMLTGEAPFEGRTPTIVMAARLTEDPVFPKQNPPVPEPIQDVVHIMMARDIHERFQNPEQMMAALLECRQILDGEIEPPSSPRTPRRERAIRKRAARSTVVASQRAERPGSEDQSGLFVAILSMILLAGIFFVVMQYGGGSTPIDIGTQPTPAPPPTPAEETADEASQAAREIALRKLIEADRFASGHQEDPTAVIENYRALLAEFDGTEFEAGIRQQIEQWELVRSERIEELKDSVAFEISKLLGEDRYADAATYLDGIIDEGAEKEVMSWLTGERERVDQVARGRIHALQFDAERALAENNWALAESIQLELASLDYADAPDAANTLLTEIGNARKAAMAAMSDEQKRKRALTMRYWKDDSEVALETGEFGKAMFLLNDVVENQPGGLARSDLEPRATVIEILSGAYDRAVQAAARPADHDWITVTMNDSMVYRGRFRGLRDGKIIFGMADDVDELLDPQKMTPPSLYELYRMNPDPRAGALELVGGYWHYRYNMKRKAREYYESAREKGLSVEYLLGLLEN
jgi:serine/threonine-protein kinase